MRYFTGVATTLFVIASFVGPLSAKTLWDRMSESTPRSGVFDDLNLTAPKRVLDTLMETVPRSDGVYGEMERNAP